VGVILGVALFAMGFQPAVMRLRGQSGPAKKPYTTWSAYQGSPDAMQYSALDQVNKKNVRQLVEDWFYPVGGEADRLPFSPLVVDNVMYVSALKGAVVALDATTGK